MLHSFDKMATVVADKPEIFVPTSETQNRSGVGQDEAEALRGANVDGGFAGGEADHLGNGADGQAHLRARLAHAVVAPAVHVAGEADGQAVLAAAGHLLDPEFRQAGDDGGL